MRMLKFHLQLPKGSERVKLFRQRPALFLSKCSRWKLQKFTSQLCDEHTHTLLLKYDRKWKRQKDREREETPNVLKKENLTAQSVHKATLFETIPPGIFALIVNVKFSGGL